MINSNHFYFAQVCIPCNRCIADIDKHIKKFHHKVGVDHIIFKKMNCKTAVIKPLQCESVDGNSLFLHKGNSTSSQSEAPPFKKPSFAAKCRTIKESDIRVHKIKSNEFKHMYDDFKDLSEDLENWLRHVLNHSNRAAKQIVTNLHEIWSSVDSNLSLYPNKLSDTNALEDNFFLPRFMKIQSNNLEMNRSKHSIKPTTLTSKLSSLRKLIEFSTSRQLYIGKD